MGSLSFSEIHGLKRPFFQENVLYCPNCYLFNLPTIHVVFLYLVIDKYDVAQELCNTLCVIIIVQYNQSLNI